LLKDLIKIEDLKNLELDLLNLKENIYIHDTDISSLKETLQSMKNSTSTTASSASSSEVIMLRNRVLILY
jgi:hypothetical protein